MAVLTLDEIIARTTRMEQVIVGLRDAILQDKMEGKPGRAHQRSLNRISLIEDPAFDLLDLLPGFIRDIFSAIYQDVELSSFSDLEIGIVRRLANAKVTTVTQLMMMSFQELDGVYGLGRVKVEKVIAFLVDHGYLPESATIADLKGYKVSLFQAGQILRVER